MISVPKVNALLICDQVIVDKYTGKKTLVGIFENINAKKYPVQHPSISVYASLTDAQGPYRIKVAIQDLQTGNELGEALIPEIHLNDRLATNEIIMNLQGLRFDHEGKYALNFSANDELIATKTFLLQRIP